MLGVAPPASFTPTSLSAPVLFKPHSDPLSARSGCENLHKVLDLKPRWAVNPSFVQRHLNLYLSKPGGTSNALLVKLPTQTMSSFNDLPFEIRKQIWIYASLPDNIHVHVLEDLNGNRYDVSLTRLLKPLCREHWVIGERNREASRSTHFPRQITSQPIKYRPYLDCLYLHCDTYEGCLSLFSFYPSLPSAVIVDLQKINLSLDSCPELGCLFTTQNRKLMSRHKKRQHNESATPDCGTHATSTLAVPEQKKCLIFGCSLVSNHSQTIREHWRKSHKGHALAILPDSQSKTWVSLRKAFIAHVDSIDPRRPHG